MLLRFGVSSIMNCLFTLLAHVSNGEGLSLLDVNLQFWVLDINFLQV